MIFYVAKLRTEGFSAGTMVKVPDGYARIEDLQKGDCIICLDHENNQVESYITYVKSKSIPQYARMHVGNELIGVSRDQQFYGKNEDAWIDVDDLKNGYVLSDSEIVVELINETIDVYLIGVAQYHNFFVTEKDICVHNFFPPIVFVLSAAFGLGSIELTTISAGIAGLGAFFGYQWHRKNKEKHKIAIEPQFYSGGMMPEDPDDEKKRKRDEARDNYESLNNQDAKKIAKKMGFRIDKNPPFRSHGKVVFRKGNTYISADRTGHKGGVWKVFRRGEGRLGTWNVDLTKRIGD
jgi:hypothetical protein